MFLKSNRLFLAASFICLLQLASLPSRSCAEEGKSNNFFAQGDISIYYPKKDTLVQAPSTYIVGSCPPGAKLSCNGQAVRINADGFFAHVLPLAHGVNNFTIEENNGGRLPITIKREDAPKPVPTDTLKLIADSAYPNEDLGVSQGDTIDFSIRATPGAQVSVSFANHQIALSPLAGKKSSQHVNLGTDTTYGVQFTRFGVSPREVYTGFYTVKPSDRFSKAKVIFKASFRGTQAQAQAKGKLTLVEQAQVASTKADDTTVRLGPNMSRTTPLAQAVLVLVDGWQGDFMRILLAQSHHVWIDRKDLDMDGQVMVLPTSEVKTLNLQAGTNEERVVVPLAKRLPYQIKQSLNPNSLTLTIYGATANTDWVTPEAASQELVDHVTFRQASDKIYELKVALVGQRQWGYFADYDGTNLVLHIKKAPHLVPGGKRLSGLTVCLDPGHGGAETGAIGPSGVHESQINLAVALMAKDELEAEGARVVMTRLTDNVELSLADRVKKAAESQADILLSIHNNALPDGRDPWAERGTSSYWYHVQALELARTLRGSELARLGFPDFGTFWENLALTRPSRMLACLVELGFMVNPDEYSQLLKKDVQHKAAKAICEGIEKYLAVTPPQ